MALNLDELLNFTIEDANEVFDELKDLGVELDADPLAFGPKRLNQKVAEVRRALGRTERLYLNLSQRHHFIQRSSTIVKSEIEMAKKDLFANDPETRAGRSVSDREAIAAGKLRDKITILHEHELAIQSLDAVLAAVKATRSDLRDTQGRLRDQVRLCMEEIGLGNVWGSKVPNASPLKPHSIMAPAALAQVDKLVGAVDGEIINPGYGIDIEDEEDEEGTGFTEAPPVEVDVGIIVPAPTPMPEPAQVFVPVEESEETEDYEEGLSDSDLSGVLESFSEPGKTQPDATAPDDAVYDFLDKLPENLMDPGKDSNPNTISVDESLGNLLQDFESLDL